MTPRWLYHGTSARHLKTILHNGLEPRGKRKSVWTNAPSRPDHVYLTQAYPVHFALSAINRTDHRLAVIRVCVDRLDQGLLYADEDALESYNRGSDGLPEKWTMKQRVLYYAKNWAEFPAARNWLGSLQFLGNCSHVGPIRANAIDAVALVDSDCPYRWASDPTITAQNFRILGPYYKAYTEFLFEGAGAQIHVVQAPPMARIISADHYNHLMASDCQKGIDVYRAQRNIDSIHRWPRELLLKLT